MSDDENTEPGGLTEDLVGTVLAGRYRVLETIGQGGAGRVYLGVQEPLGRTVAIKVLREDLRGAAKTEFSARFEREAAVAGRLNHPNVVTVHDYGTTERGLRFVVMERLTGPALSALVKAGQPMEPRRAARIVADLAKGLAAAHEAGLIHRDVKPQNVIVQQEDGRERPVLLDFGLVKVVATGGESPSDYSTRAGTYMGTPAYMAPEQAKGEAMDHRVDVYALGCMLYRLLAGVTPYTADHPLGMAVQHMTEPFPPMSVRSPGVSVPPELERITERCMRKSPDARYPDCRALVVDLERWLGEAPPTFTTGAPAGARLAVGVGAVGASVGLLGVGAGILAILVAIGVVLVLPGGPSAPEEPRPALALPPEPPSPEMPEPVEPAAGPSSSGVPVDPAPQVPDGATAPGPAPVAEPIPAPLPVPSHDPMPAPGPVLPMPMPTRPVPPPPPRSELVVDDVGFTAAEAARALEWVNGADADALKAAGVYLKGVEVILANRPFASMEAFGETKGIGTKTVEAVLRASK
ncbi:MAG: protein kinase [Myxococcota bacterium]